MKEPELIEIKSGWAAMGDGWAVEGATQEEAIRKYNEAVHRREEIATRPFHPHKNRAVSDSEAIEKAS